MLIQLVDDSWERRFTADPQRAQEAMDLYLALGYEVRAEAVSVGELQDECGACHPVASQFKTIYTRKKSGTG